MPESQLLYLSSVPAITHNYDLSVENNLHLLSYSSIGWKSMWSTAQLNPLPRGFQVCDQSVVLAGFCVYEESTSKSIELLVKLGDLWLYDCLHMKISVKF